MGRLERAAREKGRPSPSICSARAMPRASPTLDTTRTTASSPASGFLPPLCGPGPRAPSARNLFQTRVAVLAVRCQKFLQSLFKRFCCKNYCKTGLRYEGFMAGRSFLVRRGLAAGARRAPGVGVSAEPP
jgi:hypothetical protein